MGITVYVDSYSVNEWNVPTDTESVSILIQSQSDIEDYLEDIKQLPGIERAAVIYDSRAVLTNPNNTELNDNYARVIYITSTYLETFPSEYTIESGRLPLNDAEIALSAEVSLELDLDIGGLVNYEYRQNGVHNSTSLSVVGIFGYGEIDSEYSYHRVAEAVVLPTLLEDGEVTIHVGIDQTPVTPFNALGSLQYTLDIEDSIRQLDPTSHFWIENLIGGRIQEYLNWQYLERIEQVTRSSGIIVLVSLVLFLAIRYNVNERRFESSMLMARGASRSYVNKSTNREIILLSAIGSIAGLGLGCLFSRIAIASVDFLQFDIALLLTEPFLVSLESLLLSVAVGFLLPIATLLAYRTIYSAKRRIAVPGGRLVKVTKAAGIIRWDILVIVLTSILIMALSSLGVAIHTQIILVLLVATAPFILFIGVASLSIKILRRGSHIISGSVMKLLGPLPASVGVRRIGSEASSAAPVAMVLVLAISLAWSSAIIGASLPTTKLNHARFAFGGDVAFRLDSNHAQLWDEFEQSVASHELVVSFTRISRIYLWLATESTDRVQLIAMNPQEFKDVGYDHMGVSLNESSLSSQMDQLRLTPNGAIISEDISVMLDMSVGDTLRVFSLQYEETRIVSLSIIGISPALSDITRSDTGLREHISNR